MPFYAILEIIKKETGPNPQGSGPFCFPLTCCLFNSIHVTRTIAGAAKMTINPAISAPCGHSCNQKNATRLWATHTTNRKQNTSSKKFPSKKKRVLLPAPAERAVKLHERECLVLLRGRQVKLRGEEVGVRRQHFQITGCASLVTNAGKTGRVFRRGY